MFCVCTFVDLSAFNKMHTFHCTFNYPPNVDQLSDSFQRLRSLHYYNYLHNFGTESGRCNCVVLRAACPCPLPLHLRPKMMNITCIVLNVCLLSCNVCVLCLVKIPCSTVRRSKYERIKTQLV